MTEEEIRQLVYEIIDESVGREPDNDLEEIRGDLGDSLDAVEMVMRCEEKFKIEIPDKDTWKIKTVKDAIDYLFHRVND